MQKCTGLYNYGVGLSKLKLILGVLITSLFISSCSSGPIDSITGSGEIENIKLSESGTKLQKSIDNVEDMCTLFTNLSEYVYWSSIIGKGSFSSQEETKIKKYILSLELISSLDRNYKPGLNESLQDLWPTINDGYLPALDKITLLIEIFHPGCVYSEIVSSGSVAESQPENTKQKEISFSGLGKTSGTEKMFFKGSYKVIWRTEGTCYYSGDLKGGNLASFDFINAFSVQDSAEGTTNIYDLAAGEYFLKVTTGPTPNCPWSVAFTPID